MLGRLGRDEAVFDPRHGDVNEFVPERWIDADGKLYVNLSLPVFGQGRRMCQGKKVALDGTFMQMACIIWAFNIEAADTPDPLNMEVTGSMTAPSNFSFRLKPRGPWVEEVIHREWTTAETNLGVLIGVSRDVES
jgi:cytochrome P450